MSEWAPRVLVVGWDGGDWRILRRLMDRGHLPHLAALLSRSAYGELLSTVPAVTGPAWSSFMTGLWPAHHGLLSWQLPLNEKLERPWINASALHGRTLWDVLGNANQRIGVLNVPLTYPPPAVNGLLVSGMLTPSVAAQFTYPPELREALLAELPRYALDVEMQRTERDTRSPSGIRRFLVEVRAALDDRERALEFMWRQGPFDFFMVVFETPDRLQHALYQFACGAPAEVRPDWDDVQSRVIELYARCDTILGSLMERAANHTTFVLLSDHGFGPLRAVWHLNDWLTQAGYLRWSDGENGLRARIRRAAAPVKRWLPQSWKRRGRAVSGPLRQVDWPATAAYAGLPTEEGIWLNVRGREPMGTVEPGVAYEQLRDELIRALHACVDPGTGRPMVLRALRREEVHDGPYSSYAPDIVLMLDEGYKVTPGRGWGRVVDNVSGQGRGIHRREGMLAMCGPQVKPGPLAGAALPDLLPTILMGAGLPAPQGLAGRSLIERTTSFQTSFAAEHDAGVVFRPAVDDAGSLRQETRPKESVAFTEEEAALVAARLADLGYLE